MVADDWPRLAVFVIALRDPLPLPHGATFTRELDERIGVLRPTALQVEDDPRSERVPAGTEAHQIVSLKIWQLRQEGTDEDRELIRRAFAVLEHLTGEPAAVHSPAGPPAEEDYRTVVEAVTFVESPDDVAEERALDDVLTRCLRTLFDVVRAYRLVGQTPISELTYERVVPVVPYRWRKLAPPEFLGSTGLVLLDHTNVTTPAPDPLTPESLEACLQQLERLLIGSPFTLYAERRLESAIAHERDGMYAESVIQSAIAAEVLLDGVLGMLVWEEQRREGISDVATAAQILSTPLAKRIRSAYHPRLGGTWSLADDGPLRRWYVDVAGLRNRVVHRGYRPTRSESAVSRGTLVTLEQFVCDRLAERCADYPRTALAILGADGLRRRERWNSDRFDVIGALPDELRAYVEWRSEVDAEVTLRRTA
ncbi:hypothetical protein [Mumia quercus]|uniref:hypothetical protein n=1 Tax=Mumia quercus TaxID=2976125 RepID=UPI0021D04F02|nr:hypothetical protein [Mumia quercus]